MNSLEACSANDLQFETPIPSRVQAMLIQLLSRRKETSSEEEIGVLLDEPHEEQAIDLSTWIEIKKKGKGQEVLIRQ